MSYSFVHYSFSYFELTRAYPHTQIITTNNIIKRKWTPFGIGRAYFPRRSRERGGRTGNLRFEMRKPLRFTIVKTKWKTHESKSGCYTLRATCFFASFLSRRFIFETNRTRERKNPFHSPHYEQVWTDDGAVKALNKLFSIFFPSSVLVLRKISFIQILLQNIYYFRSFWNDHRQTDCWRWRKQMYENIDELCANGEFPFVSFETNYRLSHVMQSIVSKNRRSSCYFGRNRELNWTQKAINC